MEAIRSETCEQPATSAPEVDVTLIDAMLRLSPEERLHLNDRMLRLTEELRRAFAARQPSPG